MTKEFSVKQKVGALGTLYYNSMTAFPLALLLSVILGEFQALQHFRYAKDPGFWINFSICASMGPLITYSSILCTTYNSPLATSITGNVKDIGLTVLGAMMFSGYKATTSSISGLLLSFIGAGLYSWVSLKQSLAAPVPTTPIQTADTTLSIGVSESSTSITSTNNDNKNSGSGSGDDDESERDGLLTTTSNRKLGIETVSMSNSLISTIVPGGLLRKGL
jgi:hypothetical protein